MANTNRDRVPPTDRTVNRYLEAIFYIDAEGDEVRAARLADWLEVAPATVSVALQRMVENGWIAISKGKAIALTRTGRIAASRVVRTHRIAERWLTDVLGMDWTQADEEASELEHAMSADVAERLYKLLGEPATCPHGNPIPGAGGIVRRERSLDRLAPGERSRIARISEVSEHDAPDLLRFLGAHGLFIGASVETVDVDVGARTQTVQTSGQHIAMSLEIAGKIWIE